MMNMSNAKCYTTLPLSALSVSTSAFRARAKKRYGVEYPMHVGKLSIKKHNAVTQIPVVTSSPGSLLIKVFVVRVLTHCEEDSFCI